MKKFTIEVTKKDSSTTYHEVDRYQIKDNNLTMERGSKRIYIIPVWDVVEIDIEKIETKDVPNGEFAGADQN